MSVTADGKGFWKDFHFLTGDKSIYYKQYAGDAYVVKNEILKQYKKTGTVSGYLGFPVSDEVCMGAGCSIKTTFFECGDISDNLLDFINPPTISTGACPSLSPQSSEASPDFTNCTAVGNCDKRWFEYYTFYLTPTSGKAPFRFELVGGELPPNSVLETNGRFRGEPTADANGQWQFDVKITDFNERSTVKTVHFRTGW